MQMNKDVVLPPPTVLYKQGEKHIMLSDGESFLPIFADGKLVSNGKEFEVEGIDNGKNQIKVDGKWRDKSYFEPALIIRIKERKKKRGLIVE